MSKKKLFDDESEDEIALKTENEYAKKYDTWREKEEIHKLEQKYGESALNSNASASSDSEDDSDVSLEVSEETETQFLKTLALLKTKDPRIYDPKFKFYEEEKAKDQEHIPKTKTLTFEDSDEDDEDTEIFKIEKKAEIVNQKSEPKEIASQTTKKKEGKLKDYLTGKAEHVDDEVEKDLAPLKALWSDPKLNEGEAFLRDYILNKRYLDNDEDTLKDNAELEADEKAIEEQSTFERAFNFRFEEPDQEYLKRFPRTMNSIRPKEDKRARKRAEVRTRKEEEKKKKLDDIARLKALKLKEIQEKIMKIKEVTGNDELAFQEIDVEGDFDPEQHDARMRAIFDEQYYGEADEHKPRFPDLDEEMEIENWDKYDVDSEQPPQHGDAEAAPHCEEQGFNMDAEYDPHRSRQNLLEQIQLTLGKKKRHRKRKSKLSALLSAPKPRYSPSIQKYSEYMDEYYAIECEDVVGDLPTRFKYRQVVPNDYGLSIEEILLADDKELTQWVPLKKIVRHRPDADEKSQAAMYRQRAADSRLKRKLLPSLFKDIPDEPEVIAAEEETTENSRQSNNKRDAAETIKTAEPEKTKIQEIIEDVSTKDHTDITPKKKKKRRKNKGNKKETYSNDNQIKGNNDLSKETNNDKYSNVTKENKMQHNIIDTIVLNTVKKSNHLPKEQEIIMNKKQKKKKKNTFNGFIVTDISNNNIQNQERPDNIIEINVGTKRKHNDENITKTKETPAKKKKIENNKIKKIPGVSNTKNKTNNIVNSPEVINTKNKTNKIVNSPGISNINNKNKKGNKNKGKVYNKFKNNQSTNAANDNPLNKLSDERLKAYGLNPKKYRSFLKFKKF